MTLKLEVVDLNSVELSSALLSPLVRKLTTV